MSRESLLAANIDPDTRLATDYLNHFNEVVMLLDLVADMPDMCEDVLAWAPLGYCEHFQRSGFKSRAIAVAAYDFTPPVIRAAFEATIRAIDAKLLAVQRDLVGADPATIARIAPECACDVRPLLARADRLIHGATAAAAAETVEL